MRQLSSAVGIGFRKEIAEETLALAKSQIGFLEVAPENWMGLGGRSRQLLERAIEKFPLTCHGLSLSLGSPEPLDECFLRELKQFFAQLPVCLYSEHLSYCKCGNAHLYDLLPMPFNEEAVAHVAKRIRKVQDFLERPIAIENISYYYSCEPQISEAEFLTRVVEESDCGLLLDVNNVYVNAFNHGYDPYQFLENIPLEKVVHIHIAGHEKVAPDLIIDTHAEPIIDPVYQLLEWTLNHIDPVPILLERDSKFDDFAALIEEVEALKGIVERVYALK
ncbi:MAG: DUF692 domain-containing protein [Verrucomicrobia bacterium]|nr:DUF692 domain-containing protein [Verrucomicrobiota bacterium]